MLNISIRKREPKGVAKRLKGAQTRGLHRAAKAAAAAIRRLIRFRRDRKKDAPPGRPPYSHMPGHEGLRMVIYRLNERDGSVTIGPKLFSEYSVPEVLEFGGYSNGRKYAPRPYLKPALAQVAPKLDKLIAEEVAKSLG